MLQPKQVVAGLLALGFAFFLVAWSAFDDAPSPRLSGTDVVRFGANAAIADPFEFVFDESVVRRYALTLSEGDWIWLNNNALLEQYVPSRLLFEGAHYNDVGLRYKGNFGALRFCHDTQGNRVCEKLSFKLKFNEYDARGRFFGLKRLNFHSMDADPTKLHDMLGYRLFRDAGVIAPRTTFAWLTVNGEPQGLFVVVEEIDDRFVAANFPDGGEGNLYKEIWPVHVGTEPYLLALDQTIPAADEPDVTPFQRFAVDLLAAQADDPIDDEAVMDVLRDWTDLDALIRYVAVDRFIDHWDGILAWYCVEIGATDGQVRPSTCFNHNYFWYRDTQSNRFTLIPWDLDHTFEYPSPILAAYGMPSWDTVNASCHLRPVFFRIPARAPACDPIIHSLATVGWDAYVATTRALLAQPEFQVDSLYERIDRLSDLIAESVRDDPNGPSYRDWRASVDKLKRDIASMRADLEATIGS